MYPTIHLGTAGWTIPKISTEEFPGEGTHLARYARVFTAVEINSSFYRPHRPATYARWAASTPVGFRFTVKVPRAITHADNLALAAREHLGPFDLASRELGARLGCFLVQLPPRRAFTDDARALVETLRNTLHGAIGLEPRHVSWFTPAAEDCLAALGVARVAADPPVGPRGDEAAGAPDVAYYRLHGSPRVYYTPYGPERLAAWRTKVLRSALTARAVYVVFDNTAEGAATTDALGLLRSLTAAGR